MNRTVAMAAAAAVVLAGCANPTAQPTASTAASAAPAAAASTPWVRAGDHRWQQLPTVAGDPLPPGSGLQPGASIVQRLSNGGGEACTAGGVFTDEDIRPVVGASGHCDRDKRGSVYGSGGAAALGNYTGTVGGEAAGAGPDLSWLKLSPGQAVSPDAGRIAGRWPVIGVMSAAEIRQLPLGTPLCVMTGSAGPRCGTLGYADKDVAELEFAGFTPVPSDSGSVVFLVAEDGGAVLLGGMEAQIPLVTSTVSRQTFTYYSDTVANRPLHPILGA